MNSAKVTLLVAITLLIGGCSTMPKGPKLYDNVLVEILNDNAILVPQDINKEFLRTVGVRLNEATEAELASQGDLKIVKTCGPRTMKITQDIASIAMSSYMEMNRNMFRPQVTTTKNDDVNVTINTTVTDCETGKTLAKFSYPNTGKDPVAVLNSLASWNVSYAYGYQFAPRPRQSPSTAP